MNHKQNCSCSCHPSELQQTLSELDFERGIWNAVIYNEVKRIDEFVRNGHTNDRDNFGYTGLHYAARNGNLEICQKLIENGNADVNAVTKSGATALHRAAMMGHYDIVKLLVNSRAKLIQQDEDGRTALHRSAQKGNFIISKYLLDHCEQLKCIRDHKQQLPFDLIPKSNAANQTQELTNLLEL